MQQIAMRAMHLNRLIPGSECAARGGGESFANIRHAFLGERFGLHMAFANGGCCRPHQRPRLFANRNFRRTKRPIAFKGTLRRTLAPRMAKLHRRHRTLRLDETRKSLHRFNMRIGPKPKIAMGNATLAHHACDFGENQPKATNREATKLHQMPIIRQTFDRRILAKWWHHHAIWYRHTANGERREKQGTHGASPIRLALCLA